MCKTILIPICGLGYAVFALAEVRYPLIRDLQLVLQAALAFPISPASFVAAPPPHPERQVGNMAYTCVHTKYSMYRHRANTLGVCGTDGVHEP